MFVAVARLGFHLSECHSLKEKRSLVKKLVERTRSRFNASVAEVDKGNVHQVAVIGVTVIGNEAGHVDRMISTIIAFMERLGPATLNTVSTECIALGDELVNNMSVEEPPAIGIEDFLD